MWAYVFDKKGSIVEKELDKPYIDEHEDDDRYAAILKPLAVSPCSSDVHTVYAGNGPRRDNLVLGHEGIAEVVETGSLVKDFKAGDRVIVSAVMPDEEDGTGHEYSNFSGTKLGRNINGMWAEFFKVPKADMNLVHLPEELDIRKGLMAADVMPTGFTAAIKAEIEDGQTVCVIGAGAIGLMAIAAAKKLGAGKVIVVGSASRKESIELSRHFGADVFIAYQDGSVIFGSYDESMDVYRDKRSPLANALNKPEVDRILNMTENKGVDRVLICGGGRAAVAEACDIVKYGTGIVVSVEYQEGQEMIGLPVFSLGRGMAGKTFKFSLSLGGRHIVEKMLSYEDIEAERLVTHCFKGRDKIPEALELMNKKGRGLIKIMVEL
ncbi:MAG: alcohol dehydrogenase catalytic domain-containing protein [Eubacteriales bacterium]|nr:alcohol dehydrogenase catalytic domain-containing protein [Eubacteriales bacterium]